MYSCVRPRVLSDFLAECRVRHREVRADAVDWATEIRAALATAEVPEWMGLLQFHYKAI